jgi:hypothetical protein
MKFSTQMKTLLTTIDFPAHPSDLLREAARDGVPAHEVEQLGLLPDRAYQGAHDVTRTLRHNRHGELVK